MQLPYDHDHEGPVWIIAIIKMKNSYFELICPVTKIIVKDEALNICMTFSCLIFRAYAGLWGS
jgi:hypothetical protein